MIAKEIIDLQSRLEGERSTFESHWKEIAQVILPRQDDFFQEQKQGGEKRNQNKYDDTGALALDRFSAAMESILTPRSSKWHGLSHPDQRVNENQEAAEWYDNVTDLLFRLRYSSKANFASQQHENYMSLGAFGTAVKIITDVPGGGFRYKSSHISEHFFMENMHGTVDTNYRKYRLTARQAREKFPDAQLPPAIEKALEKAPNEKFWFIHCVRPNEDYRPGQVAPRFWKFVSHHIAMDGATHLSTGYFRTFPFIISRYVTSPNEVYGRSPGMIALSEIKMLNAMRKSDLRSRHMAIDPPILAADQATVRRVQMKPRHINYGGLDAAGNALIKPFDNHARIDLSNDVIQQSREFINDTFLVTLFQILVDQPQMTATEVLQRAQEKGALLSPTMGRQQTEDLGRMIERELDILDFYGYFDEDGPLPMPQAIRDASSEDDYKIEFTSPLNRMQKAEQALATERTIQSALPFVELMPEIMDNFDLDQYVEIMHDANGAPARLMRSKEEIEGIRTGRQQQQQLAALVEAAPSVAGSIKDIAQAEAAGG